MLEVQSWWVSLRWEKPRPLAVLVPWLFCCLTDLCGAWRKLVPGSGSLLIYQAAMLVLCASLPISSTRVLWWHSCVALRFLIPPAGWPYLFTWRLRPACSLCALTFTVPVT